MTSLAQFNTLRNIGDVFQYPCAEAMYGQTFQDLTLVCQVCRHNLLAGGKAAVSQPSLLLSWLR